MVTDRRHDARESDGPQRAPARPAASHVRRAAARGEVPALPFRSAVAASAAFALAARPGPTRHGAQPRVLQRIGYGASSGDAPPLVHDVLRAPGSPLDASTRGAMQRRLGYDLGKVRIHTDDRAAASARAVRALAYTVGSSIVFDRGRYAPQHVDGQRLLAHELVHTIQQGRPTPTPDSQPIPICSATSPAEQEAAAVSSAAVVPSPPVSGHARPGTGNGPTIGGTVTTQALQRQPAPGAAAPAPSAAEPDLADASASAELAAAVRSPELALQALSSLQTTASLLLTTFYGEFGRACTNVKTSRAAVLALPTLADQLLSVFFGILAPGVALPVLALARGHLTGVADAVIDFALRDRVAAHLSVEAGALLRTNTKLASTTLVDQWLAVDAARAQAGLTALTAVATAKPAVSTASRGVAGLPVPDLINQFERTFGAQVKLAIIKREDISLATALGIIRASSYVDREFYESQINDLVDQHVELAAAADVPGASAYHREMIVLFESWGVKRPAILTWQTSAMLSTRPYWQFKKWVSDEMRDTAIALASEQSARLQTVRAGQPFPEIPVQGHAPEPGVEDERVVLTDIWHHPRLAYASVVVGKATFGRWVRRSEVGYAQMQAIRQRGGLTVIARSQWKVEPIPPSLGSDDDVGQLP